MSITDSSAAPELIESRLREFLADNFFVEHLLNATESLTDAGVIDSTGVLEVVAWIEDTFAIEIPDADILPDNLDSIVRIVRYVTGSLDG